MIHPITVQLLVYGTKTNVQAIINAAESFMEEECEARPDDAVQRDEADGVAKEILATLWDPNFTLPKVTKSQQAARITMPEVHERFAVEFVKELKVAKTCTCLATWRSPNDGEEHQILYLKGEQWADSREAE